MGAKSHTVTNTIAAIAGAVLTSLVDPVMASSIGPQRDSVQQADVATTVYLNDDGSVKGITEMWSKNPLDGACAIPAVYFFDAHGNVVAQVRADQRCVGANNPFDKPHHRKDEWSGKIPNRPAVTKATIIHFSGGKNPYDLLKDNLDQAAGVLKHAKSLNN